MADRCNRSQYADAAVLLPGIRRVQIDGDTKNAFTIANVTITTANSEQSYALPLASKGFEMRVRGGASLLQVAYNAGDSGTLYQEIPRGTTYSQTGLNPSLSYTLYFQSSVGGVVVEILSWT